MRSFAGAAAVAAVFAALLILPLSTDRPSAQDIEQARRDLALALAYLEQSREVTRREVSKQLGTALIDPVTHNTAEAISLAPVLREELEL